MALVQYEPPCRWTIITVGEMTEHWEVLVECYPDVINCCIDVRDAFHREYDESTEKSGFSSCTRDRMRAKEAWPVVWEASMCVLRVFGILVLVCNHGKHRSLSLGYEVAKSVRGELISPRDRKHHVRLGDPREFISYLGPRLQKHTERFGRFVHPISSIMVAVNIFDPDRYLEYWREQGVDTRCERGELHDIHEGDLVVCVRTCPSVSSGWSYGSVIRGSQTISRRWFPPAAVEPLKRYHFPRVCDLTAGMLSLWNQG